MLFPSLRRRRHAPQIRSPVHRPQLMRCSKISLLTFGAGLLLGLVAIAFEIGWLERPASFLMAFGIAGLPFGMLLDWRRATKPARPATKKRVNARTRRVSATARRPARPHKPASPKR